MSDKGRPPLDDIDEINAVLNDGFSLSSCQSFNPKSRNPALDEELKAYDECVSKTGFYRRFVDLELQDARSRARSHSRNLFAHRRQLKAIIARHESTIHKRWTKKTQKQRREALLAAWPNLAPTHRPDIQAFRASQYQQRLADDASRDAFMFPYMNLEDLTKPRAMLLMLQARAGDMPDDFAYADSDAMRLGVDCGAIATPRVHKHAMKLYGGKDESEYGVIDDHSVDEIKFVKDEKGNFNVKAYAFSIDVGLGMLVLEAQEKLLSFLVLFCKLIMHNIPEDELTSDLYETQPMIKLQPGTCDGFASLAVMAAESPYRVPGSMDLTRMMKFIVAKKTAAEDHVWALREDPSYFSETLIELRDHQFRLIKDKDGKSDPVAGTRKGEDPMEWWRVIGMALADAHWALELWTDLYQRISSIIALEKRYRSQITPYRQLPGPYLREILEFRIILNTGKTGPLRQFKATAPASPALRKYFVRKDFIKLTSLTDIVALDPTAKPEGPMKELLWLLDMLWNHVGEVGLIGVHMLLEDLDRLILHEPAIRSALAGVPERALADLHAIGELRRQLDLYQPWAISFDRLLFDARDYVVKLGDSSITSWDSTTMHLEGPRLKRIVELGKPEGRKFHHPIDKRRTKENVDLMVKAEHNLDAFWKLVDLTMTEKGGDKLHATALYKLLSQARALERTMPWSEPSKMIEAMRVDSTVLKPLSELYLDLEQRTENTIDRSKPRTPTTKKKTRSQNTTEDSQEDDTPAPAPQPVKPYFALDARSLKVFRTLFFTPSISATPGEVAWTDFLHAMVVVGFEVEKLYGSVWQFVPTRMTVARGIHFHEPHPSGKLSYVVARRFGRRLQRAYGLDGSCFGKKEA